MKYALVLTLSCLSLSSCMLKSQHDASIAEYKKRAQDSNQLLQENTSLKQEVSDLTLRNQDLSNLNQQLVIKNRQLTENGFKQKNQSLDELKKIQQSKQLYLTIYDQLATTFPSKTLSLKDTFVGIKLTHKQIFSNSKPALSSSGKSKLEQILKALPSQQNFSIHIDYQNKPQSIKRLLQKTYVSQHSLRAFEAALIGHYFSKNTDIKSHSSKVDIDSSLNKNGKDIFTIKISHIP